MSPFCYATSIVVVVTVLIGDNGGVSALKCYSCDSSSPTCLENFFVSLGTDTEDNCVCCVKHVTEDKTSRSCATGLAAVDCVPLPDNHVCTSDHCNTATTTLPRPSSTILSAFSAIFVAVAASSRYR